MIYLLSPYSHDDSAVREHRYHEACRAVVHLLRHGFMVFSPVVHSHPLVAFGLPSDWTFWERADREHLTRCDEVLVLTLDGWEQSIGLAAEIEIAKELGKPFRYLSLEPE
jgi:hypothetical protein